jgi:hypothetical protein
MRTPMTAMCISCTCMSAYVCACAYVWVYGVDTNDVARVTCVRVLRDGTVSATPLTLTMTLYVYVLCVCVPQLRYCFCFHVRFIHLYLHLLVCVFVCMFVASTIHVCLYVCLLCAECAMSEMCSLGGWEILSPGCDHCHACDHCRARREGALWHTHTRTQNQDHGQRRRANGYRTPKETGCAVVTNAQSSHTPPRTRNPSFSFVSQSLKPMLTQNAVYSSEALALASCPCTSPSENIAL